MSDFYNLQQPTNYMERGLFLDGQVSIHRFEQNKYPKLVQYEKLARSFFWKPEEVSLQQDKIDMKTASKAVRHIFTSNLLRQTALDSLQGKLPSVVLIPATSQPEAEGLFLTWGFFEGVIHNRSYAHIIQNIYGVPKEEFDRIHDVTPIVEMAANTGKYYDDLYKLNCLKEVEETTGIKVDKYQHKKAVWMALHASYALEAIRFTVSFATSLAMKQNRLFMGNGNIIELIMKDEYVHADFVAYIINKLPKDDPDFARIKEEMKAEVYRMYLSVKDEEKAWAKYQFIEGSIIGLNEAIMCDHVDYTTWHRLKDIGISYGESHPTTPPLRWMEQYEKSYMRQKALQETENVDYVLGSVSNKLDVSKLLEVDYYH